MPESKAQYYGPTNTGFATVLPRESPSLFDIADQLKQDRLYDEAVEREEAKLRGSEIAKTMEYNPEEVWQPYSDYQNKLYNDMYVNEAKRMYKNGRIPSAEEKINLRSRQEAINTEVNKINGFKDEMTTFVTDVNKDADGVYNKEFINESVGRLHLDAEGGVINPADLDVSMINNIKQDPRAYDRTALAKKFMDKVSQSINTEIQDTPEGYSRTKTKFKNGFEIERDGDDYKTDADGNYVIKMNSSTFNAIMSDPLNRMQVDEIQREEAELGNNISKQDAAARFVSSQVAEEKYIDMKESSFKRMDKKEALKKKNEEEKGRLRKEKIALIQSGDPEAIRELIGAKSGKSYITKASYNTTTGSIDLTYDSGLSESIPSSDFNRLNNIYGTLPSQEKVSDEILSKIPPVDKITPDKEDADKINRDINTIITAPVNKGYENYREGGLSEGKALLESIPGVSKVEFIENTVMPGYSGEVVLNIDGEEETINLFSPEGGDRVKELLFERKKDDYMIKGDQAEEITGSVDPSTLQKGKRYIVNGAEYTWDGANLIE